MWVVHLIKAGSPLFDLMRIQNLDLKGMKHHHCSRGNFDQARAATQLFHRYTSLIESQKSSHEALLWYTFSCSSTYPVPHVAIHLTSRCPQLVRLTSAHLYPSLGR
jgi:hypothetical protein